MRLGCPTSEIHAACKIDPVVPGGNPRHRRHRSRDHARRACRQTAGTLRRLKAMGFSDARLGGAHRPDRGRRSRRSAPRARRPAGLTSASTPARPNSPRRPPTCIRPMRRRSPAQLADEARRPTRKKVIILGGGPNRIGQGIEFDYCCCHAASRCEDAGYETIMVNCNPETVSTDYDTSDRLYFEPLTAEDVLEIIDAERSRTARCTASSCSSAARRRSSWRDALGERRCADPRHLAGRDRPGRRPRPLQASARQARPQAAEERHRLFGRAGARSSSADLGLPDRGAPVLCARRPRDADHPRRGRSSTTICSAPCPSWCRTTSRRAIPTTRPGRSTRCSARTRCCSTAI